jgi:hypothetical protein
MFAYTKWHMICVKKSFFLVSLGPTNDYMFYLFSHTSSELVWDVYGVSLLITTKHQFYLFFSKICYVDVTQVFGYRFLVTYTFSVVLN